jgi:hypothetical protein
METGRSYVYTVREQPVEGYITGIDGTTIYNTTTRPEMTRVTGTKTWMDDGRAHDNASEIKLVLWRSVEGGAEEVVTDAQPVWEGNRYYFYNVLKADAEGNAYTYRVTEEPVEGYDAFYDGNNITNRLRYDVLPVEISGTKYWIDNDDAEGLRPETITVILMRDGEVIERKTFGAADNWQYAFTDLPDNDGYGHYYTYTITEEMVAGYWLRMDGYDLYNTHTTTPPPEIPDDEESEEELEELIEIFDYEVPLWGELLGTGDEIPMYTYVFGLIGLMALAAYVLLNRRSNSI